MRILLLILCLSTAIVNTAYAQNEDFAKVTVTAGEEPLSVKVNGELIDKLEPNRTLSIGIGLGERKNILLEDSKGNKYLKTVVAARTDKGKNFKVTYPKTAPEILSTPVIKEVKNIPFKKTSPKASIASFAASSPAPSLTIPGSKEATPSITNTKKTAGKIVNKKAPAPVTKNNLSGSASKSSFYLSQILAQIRSGKSEISDKEVVTQFEEAKALLGTVRKGETIPVSKTKTLLDTLEIKRALSEYEQIRAGEKPASSTLIVALKNNREKDLHFFLNKDNIKDPVDEQPILIYALEKKLKASVFQFLVETAGPDTGFINNANHTFPDKSHYLLPLTKACLNGDTDVVNILIDAAAYFVPDGLTEEDEAEQAKYLWKKFERNPTISALIRRRIPEFYDPQAKITEAIASIGRNMVLVQGGSFKMGCHGDPNTCGRSWPMIEVTVPSFYISKYEMTQSLWQVLMESNPGSMPECPECPVDQVSWDQVQEFIDKLNNITGKRFRLPTEKEWEYAAKGGAASRGYKYSGSNNADSVAWFETNCSSIQPVGKKWPNELGLYDMSGNAAEFCSNFMTETLEIFKTSDGPASGTRRVHRGGAANNSNYACLTTTRTGISQSGVYKRLGFRLVMEKD